MTGPDSFISIERVTEISGFSRPTIYRKVRAGTFPAPYKPGGASSRWSLAEVLAWQEEVKAARAA